MLKVVAVFALAFAMLAGATICLAQEQSPAPPAGQTVGQGQNAGAGQARGFGSRGGRGGFDLKSLDANGDGVISKDEWRGPEEIFTQADTNGDGKIDSVEFAAFREKMAERRRNRGNGENGPAPERPAAGPANADEADNIMQQVRRARGRRTRAL